MRSWVALAALVALAGCVRVVPEAKPPQAGMPAPAQTPGPVILAPTPAVTSAALAGIARGPDIGGLGFATDDAAGALRSFRESCPKLLARTDASGLTQREDWRPACEAATNWPTGDARRFFSSYFESVIVGDGKAFATGYFEPEIRGSRVPAPGYDVPVYKMPPELVRGWPDDIPESERTGRPPLGRVDASGKFVPYYERAEIEDGALANRGLEIAWAADAVEFFFLQIQGSGLLRLPDDTLMRIGYAGQNGREYVGIGSVMRERGLLGEGPGKYPGSMQGIIQYIHDNPEEGRELMRLNKSWVFFRELTTDGPLGALEVPVRGSSSVAVDPNFVPLGAPVFLDLDRNEADGLWVAQDTGGAIKGANRFDTFWGNGPDARQTAGGMSGRGEALILVPKGTAARLQQR
ncbi:murein transglycosylase A [Qipengyuania soli]|uniref:peptidoglycan lytic exotransglycosylase n=1 Tax=Qipengyuania soli TaxID=2782568 RepID=A0A7S8F209_9SPHN|nr:murein transglycosylase A [Qipengyuania soli]QPC99005.1 murein transglycosylase A [Qipengyuania soli]